MSLISSILVVIVALEHFYIMYLETIVPASAKTAETFKVSQEFTKNKTVQTLLKNQGIYNALFAVGLLYAVFFSVNGFEIAILFISFIIMAAIYGSLTSTASILLKQGGPAILALISLLVFH
ncbi:hypothetical protein MFLO_01330 [Listeria floridensis FSL S10-1187]|uniref:Integral membrane protein n=1 Tax=Listeria floridensis FSL S10-1187 TaxID=1265817 RepID=A0ABN0RIN1_9LIST|nr:DUF1304 domain-containing protein [Listeria floridensis]EUJ33828.1 hypothetical protein MFLO_01330 [Listeria floridensis FSL S10-1187]